MSYLNDRQTSRLWAKIKAYVTNAIGGITSVSFVIVQTLPATGAAGAIYLVPNSGSSPNIYDEYIYVANAWEKIGTTEIDLSGYVQKSRKINNKALSADITLSAEDVGALTSPNIPYMTCATAAGTVAKTTTLVSGKFTSDDLVAGAQVLVHFTNSNTATNPTLSMNGTTAKSIKRYGTTAPSTSAASAWNAGQIVLFVYDGTYWMMEGWINTTYSAMSEAEMEAGTSTTSRLITPARLKAAVKEWETPNPTKTSDLNNDSGFITSAPVSSVNNKTGAVSLTYSDVGAAASSHEHSASDITSGTLSAAYGGTGKASVSAAANAFMVSLNTQNATSDVTDDTLIATSANTGETNTWYRRPAPKLWNYIKGKTDALYASKSHTHPDNSFYAEYGVATFAQIKAAHEANKYVYTKFNIGSTEYVYPLVFVDEYFDGGSAAFLIWDGSNYLQGSSVSVNNGWARLLFQPVPTSRTVNGKALSSDISLTASDVGALPSNTTPYEIGAMPLEEFKSRFIVYVSGSNAAIVDTNSASVGFSVLSSTYNLVQDMVLFQVLSGSSLETATVRIYTPVDIDMDAQSVVLQSIDGATVHTVSVTDSGSGLVGTYSTGTYLTSYTETDPTVPAWAKNPTKPTYTATEVGALPIGGGTLTGPLTLNGSPTENLHPATKKYVDDIVGNIETLLASI